MARPPALPFTVALAVYLSRYPTAGERDLLVAKLLAAGPRRRKVLEDVPVGAAQPQGVPVSALEPPDQTDTSPKRKRGVTLPSLALRAGVRPGWSANS
jgi:hypothetical protein